MNSPSQDNTPSDQAKRAAEKIADELISAHTNEANRFGTRRVVYTEIVLAARADDKKVIEAKQKQIELLCKDWAEDDTDIRKLCRPFMDVDGNSYGVPTIVDLVQVLTEQLAQCRKLLDGAFNNLTEFGGIHDESRIGWWLQDYDKFLRKPAALNAAKEEGEG